MEVFAWNPAAAEALDDFNDRLASFCAENPIIDLTVSTLEKAIVLSLTLAEDAGSDSDEAIIPRVLVVKPEQLKVLEKTIGDELARIAAQDSDDAPSIPFQVTTHDAAGVYYAVIRIDAGEIEVAPDQGKDS